MGKLTKKVKKKKSRQARAKFIAQLTIPITIGLIQASSAFFLREIYNTKTLMPAWKVAKEDILYSAYDIMILKRDMALKILVDKNLLIAESAREVAFIALVGAIAYVLGGNMKERASMFMFVGGLSGTLYYILLFALLRWPNLLLSNDIIALIPTPVIVPVYIPFLMTVSALGAGIFLVFKK